MARSLSFVCALAIVSCAANEGGPASNAAGGASTGGTSGDGGVVSGGGGFPGTGAAAGSDAAAEAGAGGSAASGTGGGTNCKTSCTGNECGLSAPDRCGGSIDCGECGPGTDYCIVLSPVHQTAVKNGIEATKLSHPEYFDANDTLGESWKVLDLPNYRDSVVQELVSAGLVAIADPNSVEELRVRAASENTAENYDIYTAAGYSSYKYTSTCTPAGF